MAAHESRAGADLVHGPNVPPPGPFSPVATAYAIAGRHHFLTSTAPRHTSHATTGNLLMPRRTLAEVGWFQHFRGEGTVFDYYEDQDFSLRARRIGRRCWFEPKAVMIHDNPRRRLGAYLRHRVRCGICSTLVRYKHRDLASFGALYFENPWFFLPLAPAVAFYSALKNLLFNLGHREVPTLRTLGAAPVVLLGQAFFAAGAVRGAFLHRVLRDRVETP